MRTIGEVAEQTGLTPKAIRLYQARGLLPTVARTASGYRVFDDDALIVLRFVGQARVLGLGLQAIAEILALRRDGEAPCVRMTGLIREQIRRIDETVAALTALRTTLDRVQATSPPTENGEGGAEVVCAMVARASVG